MLRRTTGVALGALLTGLLTVVTIAPSHAATTFDVPAGPLAGDVVVTAGADPAAYPFLQVRLAPTVQPTSRVALQMANAGQVEFTVPTWGLDAEDATFDLFGCTDEASSSCTAELASEARAIDQTATASAEIVKPDGVVMLPEESISVTATNDGGGVLRVYFASNNKQQEISPTGSTDISGFFSAIAGSNDVFVGRCSTLTVSTNFCEPLTAPVPMKYLRTVYPVVNGGTRFGLNPAWTTASRTVEVVTVAMGLSYDLAWEVRDDVGQVVIGPVAAGTGLTAIKTPVVVDPLNHLNGEIADGSYNLVFTVVVHKGDLAKTGTGSRVTQLAANPPIESAFLISAQRNARNDYNGTLVLPRFATTGFPDPDRLVQVIVRDAAGHDVRHLGADRLSRCDGGLICPVGATYAFDVAPYADDLGALNAGTYSVRMILRDTWGREVLLPLGNIYVQTTRTVVRYATLRPKAARVARLSKVGSCSAVRSPGPSGVLGSLWLKSATRCSDGGDLVHQTFAFPVPWKPNDERLRYIGVLAPSTSDGQVRVACRYPASRTWVAGGWSERDGTRGLCHRWFSGTKVAAPSPFLFRVTASRGARAELRSFRVRLVYQVWYTPK